VAREFAKTAAERDKAGGAPFPQIQVLKESGLLTLRVPKAFGGQEASWPVVMRTVRQLAAVDGSLAHLYGWHHANVSFVHLLGTPQQQARWYSGVVERREFWGNASSENVPRVIDWKVTARPEGQDYRLNGVKAFCTGSRMADQILIMAALEGVDNLFQSLLIGVIPAGREGVEIREDWDNMGQRQTESGSVAFHNTLVRGDEMLGGPGSFFAAPYSTLWPCMAQLILTNVYLGIGLGAFSEAQAYTSSVTRPWPAAMVERASQDPMILRQYGEMSCQLEAARALAEEAALDLEAAWNAGPASVTAEWRGQVAVKVAQAKVLATRASLQVTSQMFEVMGARATAAKYRYDRFWRNTRTLTLHDPLEYKLLEVGNYVLNQVPPLPTFTS
jgi:alkylation response protein AidB-like acyl-CoA dehydrogenase